MADTKTLEPCPFDGAHPHHGLMPVEYDQLHGEPFQRFRVWCPHGCAEKIGATREEAFAEWNRRASHEARIAELEGLLDEALTVLDTYADPTSYLDRDGEPLASDAESHEGVLARDTAASIRRALHTEGE